MALVIGVVTRKDCLVTITQTSDELATSYLIQAFVILKSGTTCELESYRQVLDDREEAFMSANITAKGLIKQ